MLAIFIVIVLGVFFLKIFEKVFPINNCTNIYLQVDMTWIENTTVFTFRHAYVCIGKCILSVHSCLYNSPPLIFFAIHVLNSFSGCIYKSGFCFDLNVFF